MSLRKSFFVKGVLAVLCLAALSVAIPQGTGFAQDNYTSQQEFRWTVTITYVWSGAPNNRRSHTRIVWARDAATARIDGEEAFLREFPRRRILSVTADR